jgi:hypothetical protein
VAESLAARASRLDREIRGLKSAIKRSREALGTKTAERQALIAEAGRLGISLSFQLQTAGEGDIHGRDDRPRS